MIDVAKITLWDGSYHYTDNPSRPNIGLIVSRAKQRFLGSGREYKQLAEIEHLEMPVQQFNHFVSITPKSELFD